MIEFKSKINTHQHFFLACGDIHGQRVISKTISRSKFIGLLALIMGLFLGIALIFAFGLSRFYSNYRLIELRKENMQLQDQMVTYSDKLNHFNTTLINLRNKNNQIWVTAGLNPPEMELGFGGPETSFRTSILSPPELNKLKNNLFRFETEIRFLEQNTEELAKAIHSRKRQIAHYPSIRPISGGWLSSSFGERLDPFTGLNEDHPGIDISIVPHSEIRATGAGFVKAVSLKVIKNKGYGKYIIIDHGYGYETLYGHLSKIFVKKGQKVKRWDLIGLTGNTGKSTAPHLHYGVYINGKAENPINFILE